MPMDRLGLSKLWNEAWDTGLWSASWSKSVEGLTAAQAAWKPVPQRHSIWQIVAHVVFWREEALRRLAGQPKAAEDVVARMNFPPPATATESAWKEALQQLATSQEAVARTLADERADIKSLPYVLAHDCYHMGQINLLRALQDLPPID